MAAIHGRAVKQIRMRRTSSRLTRERNTVTRRTFALPSLRFYLLRSRDARCTRRNK